MKEAPAGYEWPGPVEQAGEDAYKGVVFWLSPQEDSGATQLWDVIASGSGWQTILAENCYEKYGTLIVDALRASADPNDERWP